MRSVIFIKGLQILTHPEKKKCRTKSELFAEKYHKNKIHQGLYQGR